MNNVEKCVATLTNAVRGEYMMEWALAECVQEHGAEIRVEDVRNALARMAYNGLVEVVGRHVTRLN